MIKELDSRGYEDAIVVPNEELLEALEDVPEGDSAILTMEQFDRADIEGVFRFADFLRDCYNSTAQLEKCGKVFNEVREAAGGKEYMQATAKMLFLEDSLRTRTGFEEALSRFGISAKFLSGGKNEARMSAGESPEDAGRTLFGLSTSGLLFVRSGADSTFSALVRSMHAQRSGSSFKLINCGSKTEHPTQALIDLYAFVEKLGSIDGKHIAIVGSMRMRSTHSLLLALSRFNGVTVSCISPSELQMPAYYQKFFENAGGEFNSLQGFDEVSKPVDILYMAGLPARTGGDDNLHFDDEARRRFAVGSEVLNSHTHLGNARVFCPMPRVDEIHKDMDTDSRSSYFLQSDLGTYVRMAIVAKILGVDFG